MEPPPVLTDSYPSEEGLPTLKPDLVEEAFQEEIDNIVPTRGYQMTPMVGLGGSAGSVQALTEFFRAMPPDSGMVFVVVLHLSPSHESTLAEILGRATTMHVVQAEDGQKVQPDHVYVIPPGKYLTTVNGHLRLIDLQSERGKRVAVDLFFRSLADTHGPHAAAVVLSGADGDGAIGIKRIKERGGLTIAQDPDEAEHPGMPRASIGTGMVDWVLPIADIPRRLLAYRDNEIRLKLPPEESPEPAQRGLSKDDNEAALRDVLVFLRTRTGCDFSYYKRATIVRRIARRMQVNGVEDVPTYLNHLRTHLGEAGALLQDLLISVTNFFRDRESFKALEEHITTLFQDKGPGDTLRVWVPACATGEEAYSIAMILLEHAEHLEAPPTLQIFACDLDDAAIRVARAGHYAAAITADVSEQRLRRFFVQDHHGYHVRRELREMVLFATHNLLKDAPFSRMDLISCRNLLIYLSSEAQNRVLDTFHFSLRPDGRLFLGTSESIDDSSRLFRVLDKRHRIYGRLLGQRMGLPMPTGPGSLLPVIAAGSLMQSAPIVHGKRFTQGAAIQHTASSWQGFEHASLAELHFRLVERLAPPSVIINADQEIVHLSEHASTFLRFTSGEPSMNILRVVHPMLRGELRSALFRASETNDIVEAKGVPCEIDDLSWLIDLRVSPASELAPGCYLVIFDKHSATIQEDGSQAELAPSHEHFVRHLERELEQTRARLRDIVDQSEASTEELKASNEELQAMNEELRSATEELETGREELQSINEELTTVNQEMKVKVDEIAHANSDLQNLMASTSIATVFLDRNLAITRYTPSAVRLFHLIPGDVGRPLAHLNPRLDYPDLMADAEQVLRSLVPVEREVRGNGDWFLARIQPYRTLEDHIGGAVLTFVDITERRKATEALREQLAELERFNTVAVGRETRMIELKKEVNDLCGRLAEAPRYKLDFE